MIRVECPKCGKNLKVSDDAAGKIGKCPACGKRLVVPAVSTKQPEVIQAATFAAPISNNDSWQAEDRQTVSLTVAPAIIALPRRENSTFSTSLGIAAFVLGIIAFLVSWVPVFGLLSLPLSGLGILLGGIGLLAGFFRKGRGLGFPIAGLSISLVSAFTAFAVTGVVATFVSEVGQSINDAARDSNATAQTEIASNAGGQKSSMSASTGLKPESDIAGKESLNQLKWADAANAVQQGELQVRVTDVKVGKVQLSDSFGGNQESRDDLLSISLELTNVSPTKKLDYKTWSGKDISFSRDFATLRDNFDNIYKRIDFGFSTSPLGAVKGSESIYPNKSVIDVIVFEKPIEAVKYLRLELPAANFGGTGMLRFQIPVRMISF
jgi:hypothetical protein